MARILSRNSEWTSRELSGCLSGGGIAVAPCDTIYGILGHVPDTESGIRDIKGRAETKPFIVLQSSAELIVAASEQTIPEQLLGLWPGPLTLVVATGVGTTGFRVPADPFLRGVLDSTGPLYSTSVNFAGRPALCKISEIIDQFSDRVELIVDGGDLVGRVASTVLDVSTTPYRLLRPGAVELPEEIRALCEH